MDFLVFLVYNEPADLYVRSAEVEVIFFVSLNYCLFFSKQGTARFRRQLPLASLSETKLSLTLSHVNSARATIFGCFELESEISIVSNTVPDVLKRYIIDL